jgi:hypothetical protein
MLGCTALEQLASRCALHACLRILALCTGLHTGLHTLALAGLLSAWPASKQQVGKAAPRTHVLACLGVDWLLLAWAAHAAHPCV